jgi:hypothetical protein
MSKGKKNYSIVPEKPPTNDKKTANYGINIATKPSNNT